MRLGLILLAAGNSRRFGRNKLLYEVHGKPMYLSIVEEVQKLPEGIFSRKAAVSQYPGILGELERRGYRTVANTHPEWGISYSIRLGMEALRGGGEGVDGICFAVCDQPFLKAATILALLEGFKGGEKGIACLRHQDRSGNPVIFSEKYFPELMRLENDVGGKKLVRAYPEDVCYVEAEDERELADLDMQP